MADLARRISFLIMMFLKQAFKYFYISNSYSNINVAHPGIVHAGGAAPYENSSIENVENDVEAFEKELGNLLMILFS